MLKKYIELSSRFIEENSVSGLLIALVAFALVAAFSLTNTYEIFELKLYDIRFTVKPPLKEWKRLSFVDIDENSITNIGQFPWPRHFYGTGTEALKQLGSNQCTYDIMFFDHSPSQINTDTYVGLMQKIESRKPLTHDEYDSILLDNDGRFASGLETHGKAILAYTFSSEPLSENMRERLLMPQYREAIEIFNSRSTVEISEDECLRLKDLEGSDVTSISYPIPELMKSAHSFGFVNRYTDIDGTVRKVKLVRLLRNRLYFNLALIMLADITGVRLDKIEIYPGDRLVLKGALNPMTHQRGDIIIPIDERGMMYINWAGKAVREETFHLIPYYALLDYNAYAFAVHDYFRRIEQSRGQRTLEDLNMKLSKKRRDYGLAKTAEERKALWKTITSLKNNITKVKRSYADTLHDEILSLEKDPGLKTDPGRSEEYELMKDDLSAINLVIKLEHDLADAITITGLTATGTHDIGTIPLNKEYAGVGVYHNTVNTIVNESFISRAPAMINFLVMLVIALSMGMAIQRMNARTSIITIVLSLIGINAVDIAFFSFFNIWIDQLGTSLALILPSFSIAGIKFLKEENQKRFIKNAFSHYLAPGVIEKIIENPESLVLGGEDRQITIFFSDVARFSTISEKLSPPELVSRLNEYLSEMTDIILGYGGTVDKYEGDAIMAFFGAPQSYDDHAARCCLAAIDQKKRLRELQESWRNAGKEEFHVRMGMNSGIAVVGNMGSRTRMDYTAMGDSVNLASRLEGANKVYSTYALISDSTYQEARNVIEARKLDIVRVVGKKEPILIYELLGKKDSLPRRIYDMLEYFHKGLDLFQKRQWRQSLGQFNKALELVADDGPSLTYQKRCEHYLKKEPPESWDGVYSFTSK